MYKAYMLGNTFLNDQVCFSFVPPPWKHLEKMTQVRGHTSNKKKLLVKSINHLAKAAAIVDATKKHPSPFPPTVHHGRRRWVQFLLMQERKMLKRIMLRGELKNVSAKIYLFQIIL